MARQSTEDAGHVLDGGEQEKYYISNVLTTYQTAVNLILDCHLKISSLITASILINGVTTITGKLPTNQIFKSETYKRRIVDGNFIKPAVKSSHNIGLISAMVVDYGVTHI